MKAKLICAVIGVGLLALAWVLPSLGWISSSSYEIPIHVLDSGGAESASTGYAHVGAAGQATPIGFSQSASYRNRAGYIAQLAAYVSPCRDEDEDGYEDETCGGDDCDDADPYVNPGAMEGSSADPTCADGIDNDCDGYVDTEDPDCAGYEFILELEAVYDAGYLKLYFLLGAPEPASWANYLILTDPTVKVLPLWRIPLPVIDPPMEIPVAFPLPSVGRIGIWSGLFTEEGTQAAVTEWVETD